MSRMKAASLCLAIIVMALVTSAIIDTTEDTELRDLELTGWDCANQFQGTARSQDAGERNRMKNRSQVDVSAFTREPLNTFAFLKKVRECDSRLHSAHRSELTTAQRDQLDSYENQIVSLTGWLQLAYAGGPETANCASATFHDWHLEIFESPSDHTPRMGDPTSIICEITPRTEQRIYRDNVRLQSLIGFFRLQEMSYHATGHKAQKVRVTGYLMWDDDHNSSADVGPTVEYFSRDGFHHPWRSTAWEVHPVMKIEVIE